MSSVVVFDIDGLSIRTAGCYGNVELQTPLLNEFASQACLFEQHYRSFVDPTQDRDHAYASLVAATGGTGLLAANTPTSSTDEVLTFAVQDELLEILEDRFDTEGHVAWIRIAHESGQPDDAVPLSLMTKLIEAGVVVVVTTTTPLLDENDYRIDNEEAIRVPLMVWSSAPFRIQAVTSSSSLATLLTEEPDANGVALVRDEANLALRESASLLVATSELIVALENIDDDQLADRIDVTDERLRMFRKPDDVWNIHNVLVEDLEHGVTLLIRLRQALADAASASGSTASEM